MTADAVIRVRVPISRLLSTDGFMATLTASSVRGGRKPAVLGRGPAEPPPYWSTRRLVGTGALKLRAWAWPFRRNQYCVRLDIGTTSALW
jgi:hypothetical protein